MYSTYNANAFFPAFGYYPPKMTQEYTPIAIDFRSAIQDFDGNAIYSNQSSKPHYYLKISVPRVTRKGLAQHIPDTIIVPIGPDGVFRYKLAPSTSFYPFSRYVVEYYKRKNSIPLDTQEWSVPAIPKTRKYVITYDTATTEYELPINLWQVLALSPEAEYITSYNKFRLIGDVEFANGTPLTITYQPAVTLDYLIEYNVNKLDGVSRNRG